MANEGYHEPIEELSDETRDMHKAIVSLMEELEAVDCTISVSIPVRILILKRYWSITVMWRKSMRPWCWNGFVERILRLIMS